MAVARPYRFEIDLWETLFLDQLHDFLSLSLNLFLHSLLKSKNSSWQILIFPERVWLKCYSIFPKPNQMKLCIVKKTIMADSVDNVLPRQRWS